ncbi:MAG: hypothetical protein Q8S18_01875 [Bacteroidales bacterium]|nr:hypothetical protein [Bacteroidales bacterium]
MNRKRLFILLLVLCCSIKLQAQQTKVNQDSLRYSAFERFSQKTKFTHYLHKLVFKPLKPASDAQAKKRKAKRSKTYRNVEGKVVRNIYILTYDPFGYNMQDSTLKPKGFFSKSANSLHIKTQPFVIKNLLLFKENDTFDSLLVKESERLVRSQKYLSEVLFYTLSSKEAIDSVDVYIRTYDAWSIIPSLNVSPGFIDAGVIDNNFAGFGHRFQTDMKWKLPEGINTLRMNYFVPNISNSYISTKVQYIISGTEDSVKSIEFARVFYSPLTRWAGGVFVGQKKTAESYINQDTIRYLQSTVHNQDYWVARSWQVFKQYSANAPIRNLVLSGRMHRLRFPERQPEAIAANVFNKQTIFYSGLGFSSRKYIRDNHIFNFGKVEDVPIGQAYSITLGWDVQQPDRYYFDTKAAIGNYFPFGYLSAHIQYGSFIGPNGLQQGVITGRINYFTKLLTFGNWRIRQFVKPTVIVGIKRLATDNLSFDDNLEGFENLAYKATSMMVLTIQTQSYAPWNFVGFRFGPYLFSTFGLLGNEASGFSRSRLYSVFGLGMLIKNDYLIFSTFQLSMTFYPFIPGKGTNIFNTNAFEASDYGFRGFEISKPGIIDYK